MPSDMKKSKALLSIFALLSLTITGCNFNNVSSSSSFISIDSSSTETSISSIETTSSSLNVSSSDEYSSTSSLSSSESSSSNVSSTSSTASSSSQTSSSSMISSSSSVSGSSSISSSSSAASSSASSSSSQTSSSNQTSSSSSSSSSSSLDKTVTLDIFAFNDTHGNVVDTQGKGISLAKTSTALKELSKNKNSIFISQGDMWQGSVESNYTRGNLVTEWMNSLDFVSMTVGNHEFDWGQQYIVNNAELAEFPILGINVLYRDTNTRVNYLRPSTVVERDGAKIGIIGAISDCYTSISSSFVEDIYFASGDTLTNMVKAESARLRSEENCDFIIYSIHGDSSEDGVYDEDLSNGHYVDLVLEGHSHKKYSRVDSYGVYHFQCNASNQNVYQITIDLNLKTDSYSVKTATNLNFSYSSSPYKYYQEDEEMKGLLDKYYDKYSIAYKDLGIVSSYKNADDLRSKVADLYYEEGLAKWGSQYDITLGGGFMSCRNSGIGPGMIKYSDLMECFPFDNEIALCSITGGNFNRTQFITGDYRYFITWKDESIKDNVNYFQTYYLVTDTYTIDYYPNYLNVVEYLKPGRYARDMLADYIAAGNWDENPVITDTHEGTINDPKTIEEGRALGLLYTNYNQSTPYFFKGVVSRSAQSLGSSGDMRSVYVKDADKDNEMQIYFLKKSENATLDNGNWNSVDELSIGDVLIFNGRPFYYNSSILEFASGSWAYSINGVLTSQNN